MHLYFHIGSLSIPGYGCMITVGILLANVIAYAILRKKRWVIEDFIILEAYCFLGAFVGAKALYIIVSAREIKWNEIFNFQYFSELMQGGFVFYGGLIGGVLFIVLAGKIHKLDAWNYIREFIFLIPFMHAFGRIGCFCAGCCYGMPYHGFGAVTFPKESYAISGIPLFPIQIVEAFFLLCISIVLFILQYRRGFDKTIEAYIISYAIVRFVLEYMRYDAIRGQFFSLSTSQWISLLLVMGVCGWSVYSKNALEK